MSDDKIHPVIENTDFSGFLLVAKWFSIGVVAMLGCLILS